jgi:hypothetical protein
LILLCLKNKMKSDIKKHKLKNAKSAEQELPLLMVNYQSGNLESLGKLCNAVNVLAEFYSENSDTDIARRVPRLTQYLNDKFKNCIVLVLKMDGKCFSYTANNITKFIRGEYLHGASENNDNKRKALHEFIFEKDNTIECEFHVSWNWIAGPNLRADTGNLDSGGPFVHMITLNENKTEVSLIESVIIAIAYEFWQANTNNQPPESTKCFVKFNPDWFPNLWSNDLASRLKNDLQTYLQITVPEIDE